MSMYMRFWLFHYHNIEYFMITTHLKFNEF